MIQRGATVIPDAHHKPLQYHHLKVSGLCALHLRQIKVQNSRQYYLANTFYVFEDCISEGDAGQRSDFVVLKLSKLKCFCD